MPALPFHIDVAHFLSCDAFLIQDNILGVPDNTTKEKPVEKMTQIHTDSHQGWAVLDQEAKKSAHPRLLLAWLDTWSKSHRSGA